MNCEVSFRSGGLVSSAKKEREVIVLIGRLVPVEVKILVRCTFPRAIVGVVDVFKSVIDRIEVRDTGMPIDPLGLGRFRLLQVLQCISAIVKLLPCCFCHSFSGPGPRALAVM